MKELLENLGGRRFLLALFCCAGTMILSAFCKIDGSAYAAVQIGIVGAYITGNIIQKKNDLGAKDEK